MSILGLPWSSWKGDEEFFSEDVNYDLIAVFKKDSQDNDMKFVTKKLFIWWILKLEKSLKNATLSAFLGLNKSSMFQVDPWLNRKEKLLWVKNTKLPYLLLAIRRQQDLINLSKGEQPKPLALKLRPEHIAAIQDPIRLTHAKFKYVPDSNERCIVTSSSLPCDKTGWIPRYSFSLHLAQFSGP